MNNKISIIIFDIICFLSALAIIIGGSCLVVILDSTHVQPVKELPPELLVPMIGGFILIYLGHRFSTYNLRNWYCRFFHWKHIGISEGMWAGGFDGNMEYHHCSKCHRSW